MISSAILIERELRHHRWQAGIAGLSPASAKVGQPCYSKANDTPVGIATRGIADITQLRSWLSASPAPLHDSLVRSEGLEPPRFYSLPPQGSASTNSATSALRDRHGICAGPDQRRRCNKSTMEGQGLLAWWFSLEPFPFRSNRNGALI